MAIITTLTIMGVTTLCGLCMQNSDKISDFFMEIYKAPEPRRSIVLKTQKKVTENPAAWTHGFMPCGGA